MGKNNKKLTTEEFIKKACEIYGDEFSYENTVYVNSNTKVEIVCKQHGSFWQLPGRHLEGRCGCRECFKKQHSELLKHTSNEDFIKKAKAVHSEKYTYEKTNFVGWNEKVIITCPIHGDFLQNPSNHLAGKGCTACAGILPLNNDTFIEKAKKIHGDKYDYSKVNYINRYTKVIIICPKHGEFQMEPGNHLSGERCPYCAKKYKMPQYEFIEKVKEIYADKYDYSKTIYNGASKDIVCNCPVHGEFTKRAGEFLRGKGCPMCGSEKHQSEDRLFEFLKTNFNTLIERHKKFDWLGQKHIDFYLPKYNIAIEYQGAQHFRQLYSHKLNGEEHFRLQVKRDEEKAKLCKEHNLPLLFFTYERDKTGIENYFTDILTDETVFISRINELISKQNI